MEQTQTIVAPFDVHHVVQSRDGLHPGRVIAKGLSTFDEALEKGKAAMVHRFVIYEGSGLHIVIRNDNVMPA